MDEPVAILCGGRGTYLDRRRPGFHRFALCLGHTGELIEEFVRYDGLPENISVDCVQTGEETPTGGRIARGADRQASRPSFSSESPAEAALYALPSTAPCTGSRHRETSGDAEAVATHDPLAEVVHRRQGAAVAAP
jgi:hypothetical protein